MHPSSRYLVSIVLTGLALGVAADWLFIDRWIGVSAPLFVALCLLALVTVGARVGRLPSRANLWLGAGALGFAVALAVRDEPMLVALNALAVCGLLLLQVAYCRSASLMRLSTPRMVARMVRAGTVMFVRPPTASYDAIRELKGWQISLKRLWPFLRGLIIAAPVLACFTLLLASADSVFASYVGDLFRLELPFDPDTIIQHTLVIGAVGWLCAGALFAAVGETHEDTTTDPEERPAEGITQRLYPRLNLRILGATEALTVLALVDTLFASFMFVQAAYFFGGLDTLTRTGATYATYARRGFFELLTVACLSLALLWALALFTRRDLRWQRWAFNATCGTMIVLVLGMLASAFQRMLLYEEAYGFTRLRIYTHSFMIWLALVLVLFFIALLRERPRIWIFGTCIAALLYLAALNIASPDTLIVRANVARYEAGGKFDADYLAALSADATPALIEGLPRLDAVSQTTIRNALRDQRTTINEALATQGWPSWHWARWRASQMP